MFFLRGSCDTFANDFLHIFHLFFSLHLYFCVPVFAPLSFSMSHTSAVRLSCNSYFHCKLYVRMFVLIETQNWKSNSNRNGRFPNKTHRQWNHNGGNLNKSISIVRFVHTFVCCSSLRNCIPKQQIKIKKMLAGEWWMDKDIVCQHIRTFCEHHYMIIITLWYNDDDDDDEIIRLYFQPFWHYIENNRTHCIHI